MNYARLMMNNLLLLFGMLKSAIGLNMSLVSTTMDGFHGLWGLTLARCSHSACMPINTCTSNLFNRIVNYLMRYEVTRKHLLVKTNDYCEIHCDNWSCHDGFLFVSLNNGRSGHEIYQ